MQYVFDGMILLVMIIFTVVGVKKGFVKSVAEFFGAIIAAVCASWVGGMLSTVVYDSFFRQGVFEKVQAATQGTGVETNAEKILAALPDFIVRLLEVNGVTTQTITTTVSSAGNSVAQGVTDVLSPVFIGIIKVFAVIVLFLLFMIIIKAVASLISGVCNLPVLRQVNGLLGGIFGFLFGALIIWMVIGAVQFFEPMMSDDVKKNVDNTIGNSYVAKLVTAVNPIKWIFD